MYCIKNVNVPADVFMARTNFRHYHFVILLLLVQVKTELTQSSFLVNFDFQICIRLLFHIDNMAVGM